MNDVKKDISLITECIKHLAERQKKIMKRRAQILKRINELQQEVTNRARELHMILEEPEVQLPSPVDSSEPNKINT